MSDQPPVAQSEQQKAAEEFTPQTRWEKRIWHWLTREDALLKMYQQINGTDFIMSELLMSLRELRDGMKMAKEAFEKETSAKDKLAHMANFARMQKQHLDTVFKLSKYQETVFAQRTREKSKNKSAAPGQQVALPTAPPKP